MCMMIKAYADFRHVNVQLANNGDDCVVFMEKGDLARFQSMLDGWFREMGFNMVVEEPSYVFEHIEFCQTKPVFDGTRWVMCRNPWTAIAKDSVLLKNPNSVNKSFLQTWLYAVGTGGLALAGGLPVFQSFYKARVSFYYAFGVTPDEQVELEKYYDSMLPITPNLHEVWQPREVFAFC